MHFTSASEFRELLSRWSCLQARFVGFCTLVHSLWRRSSIATLSSTTVSVDQAISVDMLSVVPAITV